MPLLQFNRKEGMKALERGKEEKTSLQNIYLTVSKL